MVVEQVPGQGAHAGDVVAADVGRGGAGNACEGDDRDLPGDLVDLAGLEQPVVQDQAVALARDRQHPAARLVVGDVHRAQQQVEAAPLRRPLHAPVEHVVELQGLGLVGERVVAEQPGGVPRAARPRGQHRGRDRRARGKRPPHDHADDFLQPHRQGPGGAVGDVAELGGRPLDPVPDLGARVAAAVQHARYRGDGDPGGPGHVVDRGLGRLGLGGHRTCLLQRGHGAAQPCGVAAAQPLRRRAGHRWPTAGKRFPGAGRDPRERLVSAYRPGRGSKRTSARPTASRPGPGNVTAM